MKFFKQKKVYIPLVVIILFHVINFLYYTVGKNDIEGCWRAEAAKAEQLGCRYYIDIYQLDQSVTYNGKEYKFIVLGRDNFSEYGQISHMQPIDAVILGLIRINDQPKDFIDSWGNTVKIVNKNKIIWQGIPYVRDKEE